MVGILWVHPNGTTITIVEERPRLATVIRAIESTARRRVDQIGGEGMNFNRVNIWINKRLRRTFERRIPIAAIDEIPCFSVVVGAEHAAYFHRSIDSGPMKGKATHTACFWRIGHGPFMLIAQLCYFR